MNAQNRWKIFWKLPENQPLTYYVFYFSCKIYILNWIVLNLNKTNWSYSSDKVRILELFITWTKKAQSNAEILFHFEKKCPNVISLGGGNHKRSKDR